MKVSVHTVKRNAKRVEISLRRNPAVRVIKARPAEKEDIAELLDAEEITEEPTDELADEPVSEEAPIDDLLEEVDNAIDAIEEAEATAAREEAERLAAEEAERERRAAEEAELERMIAEEEELARLAAEAEEFERLLAEEQQQLDASIAAEEQFLADTEPEESETEIGTADAAPEQEGEIVIAEIDFSTQSEVYAHEQEIAEDAAEEEMIFGEPEAEFDEYASPEEGDIDVSIFDSEEGEYLPFGGEEYAEYADFDYSEYEYGEDGSHKGIFRRFLDRCRAKATPKDADGVEYIQKDDNGKMARMCGVIKKQLQDDETEIEDEEE